VRPARVFFFFFSFSCGGQPEPSGLPAARECDEPPPAGDGWRLVADGPLLRDDLGRIVVLRGMNTGGRSKFAPFLPFAFEDEADFDAQLGPYWDRMAAWGFSVARLVFTWEAVEPTEGAYDEVFLSRYDRMIDAAWARGIRVIVDFHQDVYAQMYCGDGFPEWTIPAELRQERPDDCSDWFNGYLTNDSVKGAFDRFWTNAEGLQDAYFAMWDMLAARWADRPGVIGFEAINEPGWGPGPIADWEEDVLTPFYAAFAERIHQIAPDALVFFDATGIDALSADTSLLDPGVPGIVFAPHHYDPTTILEGAYEPTDELARRLSYWADLGAEWDMPVLMGEFGVDVATGGVREFFRDHMAAFDTFGMSATAWEYSVTGDLWSAENMSIVEADGTERAPHVDGLVRPYLRAAAGTSPASEYDAENRIFSGSLVPDPGGWSEIALPDRIYPEGVRVGLRGGCAAVDDVARSVRIRADDDATQLQFELRPR